MDSLLENKDRTVSSSKYPLVSVLIVTRNRKNKLTHCIESVMAQTYPNIEIIVIDNNSSDDTADIVRNKYPGIILICSHKNIGCPSGRNLGFANCRGKYIYCLDDDGWLKEDAVHIAVKCAESDEQIAVVQSQINEMKNGKLILKRPPFDRSLYISNFSGGSCLIRRDAIKEIGYFPDDFFRQAEEEDMILRLLEAKRLCIFEPKSVMFHTSNLFGQHNNENLSYTLCNTLKIALRRWPLPWNFLRIFRITGHAFWLAVTKGEILLPLFIAWALIYNLCKLKGKRRPVSKNTFKLYMQLKKQPSIVKPTFKNLETNSHNISIAHESHMV